MKEFNEKGVGHTGKSVSRREFLRIGSTYGFTAALGASAILGAGASTQALAQTAGRIQESRSGTAKHTLRLGMVYGDAQHDIQRVGVWDFVRDLEDRTNGAIRVEVTGAGALCSETRCVQQAQQGVVDIAVSSTQNGASAAPWMNALDYPFMFQSPGQIYDFLYNPESERVFRSVLRQEHGLELLFSTAELRGVLMGSTYADRPPVTQLEDLRNARIRATETQFGQTALRLMGMNPLPVAWAETLDAMRSGLVDGMETWAGAAASFSMAPVVSKVVALGFIPGTEATFLRSDTMNSLEPDLQEAVMESAYLAQQVVMYNFAAARHEIIGDVANRGPQTIFAQSGTELNIPSAEFRAEVESVAGADNSEYDGLKERLNGMAGFDAYKEIAPIARRFPADELAINVVPRRWWKSA